MTALKARRLSIVMTALKARRLSMKNKADPTSLTQFINSKIILGDTSFVIRKDKVSIIEIKELRSAGFTVSIVYPYGYSDPYYNIDWSDAI